MLHHYQAKSVDDIYLEDIPHLIHPDTAARDLADTAQPNRLIQEWNLPQGYRSFVSRYRQFHYQHPYMAYRDTLAEVRSGNVVLLMPARHPLSGVLTTSGQLRNDLPLFLHSRLNELISHQLKRPVYYVRPVAPVQHTQAAKTINSKTAGRLLAAGGIYNGNPEGFRKTAEQLGGDAPAGYDQVMNNKGLLITAASVAAGLTMGKVNVTGELEKLSSLSKIPTFESPALKGFTSESGTLLNAEHAVVDYRKLSAYSLDVTHPIGGNKARVFQSALGYNPTNSDVLADRVREGILTSPAKILDTNQYGQRMAVDMPILGVNGETVIVRSGWIYEPDAVVPRMTIFVKLRDRP